METWERLLAGDRRALARVASWVENAELRGLDALRSVYPRTGRAHVVGVTGPPGSGKSTLLNALIGEYRRAERRVGVVAVDPSSPLSGGATLGDRVRMMAWHADDGVFVRSMASRGHAGGLARATAGLVHLLDAAGYDPVFVETVGVGQAEMDIARHAHTTLLVHVPGLGDGVQALKAGLLELADILVVNKADQDGADDLVRLLTEAVSGAPMEEGGWMPSIVATVATTSHGVDELAGRIDAHRAVLQSGDGWSDRARAMARAEVDSYIRHELERRLSAPDGGTNAYGELIDAVAQRRLAPYEAARSLMDELARNV